MVVFIHSSHSSVDRVTVAPKMKNFSEKVKKNLFRFLNNGEERCLRTAEFSDNRASMERYDNVKNCLDRAISKILTSTVHYYGSRVNRMSLGQSDLDFFIEVGNNFQMPLDQEEAAELLIKIKKAVKRSDDWGVKILLPKASVPVLRLIYLRTNFSCDVTVTSGLGVCLSNILRHFNEIQPQAIPLFHFLRIWLAINKVTIKRYTQYLILLFYLQRKNYMPSIESIQKGLKKKFVDGWEVQYNPNKSLKSYKVIQMVDFKQHVRGYFQFYAKLDFAKFVLSTYEGVLIERSVYETQYDDFLVDTPLCIAGPIGNQCDRNSGKRPGITTLNKFQRVCELSCEFLAENGWN